MLPPTRRLYWEDDHCMSTVATVLEYSQGRIAFDQTCFYAGGGGQPSDTGSISIAGSESIRVTSVEVGEGDVIWHHLATSIDGNPAGQLATLQLDHQRRTALARYHTVLHVVNTIALRDYDAWITGAQIGVDYSRIDFKIERFSPEIVKEIEAKVNAVLCAGHTLRAFYLSEAEFSTRPDLLRTLEVKPPVKDGRVRVVAIEGFDEQACGGTHVHNTADLGRLEIYKTENKGKINKRLYVRLL
jgi:misacylated tRNA(Ala) deacylase